MDTNPKNETTSTTPEEEAQLEAFLESPVPVEFVVESPKGHHRKLTGTIKTRDLMWRGQPPQQLTLSLARGEILLADRAGWHPALPIVFTPADKPEAPPPRGVAYGLIYQAKQAGSDNERVMLLAEARAWFELAIRMGE